jgi:hypothetical protein
MYRKLLLAVVMTSGLGACATTGGAPRGMQGTEQFVSHALGQYGVATGSRPATATVTATPAPNSTGV